jgi:predicted metal-dependent phosphotriesterase family hydrolase
MVNRDALRGKTQTILGIVDPATLRSTLMHEHLIWTYVPLQWQRNRTRARTCSLTSQYNPENGL